MPVWVAPGLSASVMVRVSQHEASNKTDMVDKVSMAPGFKIIWPSNAHCWISSDRNG